MTTSPPADRAAVAARLAAAGCVAADAEAAELLAAAPDAAALDAWLARREEGEPLAWIIGSTTFCGHRMFVDPHVYVPRWQSEELARRAAELMPGDGGRAADLCTGSGAIAVHLAATCPGAMVIGTDRDVRSVACARRNGVPSVVADLGRPLRGGWFDVVTAVAPYVPSDHIRLLPADVRRHEPRSALDGGPDGLELVARAAADAARLLRPGGWFLTEVGGDQGAALPPLLHALGFEATERWTDEEGDLRGVAARVRPAPRG